MALIGQEACFQVVEKAENLLGTDAEVAVEGRVKCKLHAVFRTLGFRMRVLCVLCLCKHLIRNALISSGSGGQLLFVVMQIM